MKTITESDYKKFMDCPNSLWLHFSKPNEAAALSDMAKEIIKNNETVRELSKNYFPNTVDCSAKKEDGSSDIDEQVRKTKHAIQTRAETIANATFESGNLSCIVALLKKGSTGYSIYEVNAVLEIEDKHKTSLVFQKHVLHECGVNVEHLYIMHPDRDYCFQKTLEIDKYFKYECVDSDTFIIQNYNMINSKIDDIIKLFAYKPEPNVKFCGNCSKCSFNNYCTRDIPEDCVGSLNGIDKKAYTDFYPKGIFTVSDYVKTTKYQNGKKNPRRELQIKKVLNNDDTPYVDKTALGLFLSGIKYPLYYLDFETTKKIVPEFDGFHPMEEYPFQYSLHIEQADGSIEHKEFLGEEEYCMRALAEQLVKDIPSGSQLIAYRASTEKNIIKNLAKKFPDLAGQLNFLTGNFVDLLEPFKKGIYYDPKQKGSNSIKAVLPALCPHMANAYQNLPGVHKGDGAMAMFPKMIAKKGTPQYDEVRDGMLKYCELDTWAMVEVMKVLRSV